MVDVLEVPARALPAVGRVHLLRRLGERRAARFGAVAASCTAIQLLVLAGLARFGVSTLVANAIGFVLSAQANFALSPHLTWRDRKPYSSSRSARSIRWAQFNAVAVLALVVNELVFALGVHTGARLLLASAAGILAGAALTFTLNNFVTFRAKPGQPTANVPQERRPSIEDISERAQRDGVAFFLPAYNEATNLRLIVPGIVDYFRQLDCPFTVIIVDDGSTEDDTFEAAEQLARHYPRFVQAVHHPKNKGYGATIFYITARLDSLAAVSTFIDGLFPTPVFYAGAFVALAGNGVLFVQKLITPLRRQQQSEEAASALATSALATSALATSAGAGLPLADYLHQQEYGLTFRLIFTPLWWAFTSASAYRALRKLLIASQRSSWDKTPHGHELAREAELVQHGRQAETVAA